MPRWRISIGLRFAHKPRATDIRNADANSHPRLVDERDCSNCGGHGRARSKFAAAVGAICATEGSAAPGSAAGRGDSEGTRLLGGEKKEAHVKLWGEGGKGLRIFGGRGGTAAQILFILFSTAKLRDQKLMPEGSAVAAASCCLLSPPLLPRCCYCLLCAGPEALGVGI